MMKSKQDVNDENRRFTFKTFLFLFSDGKLVGVISSFDLVAGSEQSIISNLFVTLGKVRQRCEKQLRKQ
jgi:hypothetical protein